MQTANRAAPHLMLGVLTLLSLGALVLSLSMAPPNARQKLRTAASNTAGASSFVLTDEETAGPLSQGTATSPTRERAVIVYQAPDRVQETVTASGRSATVLVVGDRRYERSANGKWFDLGPSASGTTGGASAGAIAAQDILFPLQALSKATGVTVEHDVYRFVPGQAQLLLDRLIGANVPAADTVYAAGVGGEFLTFAQVVIRDSGEQVTVRLSLSKVEHAPALALPSASQITTVRPSP